MRFFQSFALACVVLAGLSSAAIADIMATADNGRRVILRDNGTWSYDNAAKQGDLAFCKEYAGVAVWQQQQNLDVSCGYAGPAWHRDQARHYNWCLSAVPARVQAQRKARFDALTQCKMQSAATDKKCQTYADYAMTQVRRNIDRKCGIDPNGTNLQWSANRAFHVDWCMRSTDAARAQISQARADALAANCKKPAPKVVHLGCFKDTGNRDLNGAFLSSPRMDPAMCFQHCRDKGFAIAGLQFGSQCFCGNEVGKFGRAEVKNCQMPCPGNPNFKCGGYWTNNAFRLDGAVR